MSKYKRNHFKKRKQGQGKKYADDKPCSHCGEPIIYSDLRNETARLECQHRGLCQKCQDIILNLGD